MPYETDERLKSFLDTNQMYREQMCLAILEIDKRFSDVRPRHPRGGPDGGRDIDAIFSGVSAGTERTRSMKAVFNDSQRAFGAVGFLNQANDSDAQKAKITAKFKDDLNEVLKQKPKPDAFIFFTNVNLTVGEKDKLVRWAKEQGIAYAEIFDRERLRISLDNPDGFGIRYQYLQIPLSEAEQATFFARWGDDIQGVISDGFGRAQKSLNRILFLQEANLPLTHLTAILDLDKQYSANEIGHFRAFASMQLKAPVNGLMSFLFGTTDRYERLNARTVEEVGKGRPGIKESMCGGQWEMRIPKQELESQSNEKEAGGEDDSNLKYERAGTFSSVGQDPVKAIRVRYDCDSFIRFFPVPRLQDVDDCLFVFFLNRKLADKVKGIRVYANAYKLLEVDLSGFKIDDTLFEPEIPLLFTRDELDDPWVRLRPDRASAFDIRFSDQTPRRFFHADEVADSPL